MTTIDFDWPMVISQAAQVAALVLVVAVVVRFVARNRPHLAHLLWLLVLVKCITPPLWSSPTGLFSWIESMRRESVTVAPAIIPSPVSSDKVASRLIDDRELRGFDGEADVVIRLSRTATATASDAPAALAPDQSAFRLSWFGVCFVIWLSGMLTIALVASARWLRCWRQLCRSREVVTPELAATFVGLAKKLGLRRRVKLLVTSSRIGPAVVGLFRPTVVLPLAVVEGRSVEDLEPILAHELIHVRRGDLWVGLLQVVAQGVWWFHPLVWFAGRMISREAERCCDEEVLAELCCSPARYARSLLAVLELKRTLTAVPAFPGVRAVEVTSSRMERIMTLGQGCRRRTPWWCWGVMLLAAAIVLPGARLLRAEEEPSSQAPPERASNDLISRVEAEDPVSPSAPKRSGAAFQEWQPGFQFDAPISERNTARKQIEDWSYDARKLLARVEEEQAATDTSGGALLNEESHVEVYNGQCASWMPIPSTEPLSTREIILMPIVPDSRSTIRLLASHKFTDPNQTASNIASAIPLSCAKADLADGGALLVDVSSLSNDSALEPHLALITARIVHRERIDSR